MPPQHAICDFLFRGYHHVPAVYRHLYVTTRCIYKAENRVATAYFNSISLIAPRPDPTPRLIINNHTHRVRRGSLKAPCARGLCGHALANCGWFRCDIDYEDLDDIMPHGSVLAPEGVAAGDERRGDLDPLYDEDFDFEYVDDEEVDGEVRRVVRREVGEEEECSSATWLEMSEGRHGVSMIITCRPPLVWENLVGPGRRSSVWGSIRNIFRPQAPATRQTSWSFPSCARS